MSRPETGYARGRYVHHALRPVEVPGGRIFTLCGLPVLPATRFTGDDDATCRRCLARLARSPG